jgi:preprotein translocase subunit SecA
VLEGEDLSQEVKEMIRDFVEERVDESVSVRDPSEDWDISALADEFGTVFLAEFNLEQFRKKRSSKEEFLTYCLERAFEAYSARERDLGSDLMRQLERFVLLNVIDEKWRDHLYEIDQLKEGIGLRAYGQKDPLIEYKSEAFKMFVELSGDITRDSLRLLMSADVRKPPEPRRVQPPVAKALHAEVSAFAGAAVGGPPPGEISRQQRQTPVQRNVPKVGRNDPCPCGSGKKYKKCCLPKEEE